MTFFTGLGITIVCLGVLMTIFFLIRLKMDDDDMISAMFTMLIISMLVGMFFTNPEAFGYTRINKEATAVEETNTDEMKEPANEQTGKKESQS